MVRVNIEIPDDLHKRVKSKASLEGTTVKSYVISSLKSRLGDNNANL